MNAPQKTTYAQRQVELEAELGALLGWRDITMPAEITPNCWLWGSQGWEFAGSHGTAKRNVNKTVMPRWTRDWSAAGELIGALDINLEIDLGLATAMISPGQFFRVIMADHPDRQAALRWAITQAAVDYLKGQKHGSDH